MRYMLDENDWLLALERYKKMPPTMKIVVLGQTLDKNAIIQNIEQKTSIGETIVAMQKNYQDWLAKR